MADKLKKSGHLDRDFEKAEFAAPLSRKRVWVISRTTLRDLDHSRM
jgi:hypothetical protein